MKHLNDHQLLSVYYGESNPHESQHLQGCAACQSDFRRLRLLLDEAHALPVPDRDHSYGSEVWRRLQPGLTVKPQKTFRLTWWLGPAVAALVVAAFMVGVFSQRRIVTGALSQQARTRVLLMAMGDHLDRSQMVLAELVNTSPQGADLAQERASARNLLAENRLLREAAARTGTPLQISVLDQLERVLMDVANGPAEPSPGDFEELQDRIKNEGLLLQVRVIGANARRKGQKL